MKQKRRWTIKYSVQFKFVALTFAFLALLLVFLNTYPLLASRDLVFTSKQSSLQSQASVAAASLSALEMLTPEGVGQVMELLDLPERMRVVIADTQGEILYDDAGSGQRNNADITAEIQRALGGELLFHPRFAEGSFSSSVAQPVRHGGVTIGAVYLSENDSEQGALLLQLQRTLRNISLAVGIAALLLLIAFARALTSRITELVRAIRIVRDGSYGHRVRTRGNDELTELGDEFNNMSEQLEKTEALRRRFVSDASHELRTPLASIRLLSDSIVQSGNMDVETMREFVSDIGAEAERLQRTSDKLLGLTRLDAAPADIRRTRVNASRVAGDTLRLLLPLAEKQQVTLRHELEEDCCIYGSGDDLYQIIFNLVENAIKYNLPAGEVFLRVCRREKEIVITVEDTGIGIPEEDLPHVFSRFYRVDKARSRASGGSGLGLSIVFDAVRIHGGSVSAERREEGGSRFTVRFPVCDEEPREQ